MEDASADVTSELLDALLSGWAAGGHVRECLTENHMKIRLGRGFEYRKNPKSAVRNEGCKK
jgi:hypothetical protein